MSKRKERADVEARIKRVKTAASKNDAFDADEVTSVIKSLKNLSKQENAIDWAALRLLIEQTAHQTHKIWENTEHAADRLAELVSGPDNSNFQSIFQRVLDGGHWASAAAAAAERPSATKPFVVLVSGLNGIRKTTSIYQPWFKKLLFQALGDTYTGEIEDLPAGSDSFFRQLDYMIATIANEDFKKLYEVKDVGLYSEMKAGIFSRYRKLAEMLGVLLLKEAKKRKLNVMVETSGRDISSFHYIDHFFADEEYHKLVVHFEINELACAEQSVDRRMQKEMADGKVALQKVQHQNKRVGDCEKGEGEGSHIRELIAANAGGPYGSAVLAEVQAASQKVWEGVVRGKTGPGSTWLKASIAIDAGGKDSDDAWSARALLPLRDTGAGAGASGDANGEAETFTFPLR